jgi:hypothetical protein
MWAPVTDKQINATLFSLGAAMSTVGFLLAITAAVFDFEAHAGWMSQLGSALLLAATIQSYMSRQVSQSPSPPSPNEPAPPSEQSPTPRLSSVPPSTGSPGS